MVDIWKFYLGNYYISTTLWNITKLYRNVFCGDT